jgi:hypothetical protein
MLKCLPSVNVDSGFILFWGQICQTFLSFNTSTDFIRSLMQNIKCCVRFYFVSGMVHPVQCQKDFPYFLFGGALSIVSDLDGQMGN